MGKNKGKKKDNKVVKLEINPKSKNKDILINTGFKNSLDKYSDIIEAIDRRLEEIKKRNAVETILSKLIFSKEEFSRILSFVDEYMLTTESTATAKIAKNILVLAKTTFENSDNIIIPNKMYQDLLKRYMDNGNDEPFPYMIDGNVREKKVTEFKTLTNNLDKGYTIRNGDPYPIGVSEANNVSVEAFLENVYDAAGLKHSDMIEIELSPKLDGISLNTGIVEGRFHKPLSRGDDDGSILFKGFENYQVSKHPLVVNHKRFGAQFEAFMTFKNRERMMDKYGIEYSSNRGAANGVMMRSAKLDTFDPEQLEYVSFYPINVEGVDFNSNEEKVEFLNSMYVGPNDMINRLTFKGDFDAALEAIAIAFGKYNEIREELSYSIDGIVISILNEDVVDKLGRSGRKNKYQIALKFEPNRAEGIIKGIRLSSGKKGFMSIMAVLDHSVAVNEKEFNEVLVGSIDKFNELDLHVGDRVEVVNVGDAMVSIAKVKRTDSTGDKIKLPIACPHCAHKLNITNGRLSCGNHNCPAINMGKMLNFLETIDIPGYSTKTIEKIYYGGIKNVYQLLTANNARYDAVIPNGRILREKIISALKRIDDATALVALSVVGLGKETSEKILSQIPLKELIADFDVYVAGEKLKTVPGIGDSIFKLLSGIHEERKTLVEISKYVTKTRTYNTNALRIATTKVSSDTKNELKAFLEGNPGYKIVDSKSFDILVVDDYEVSSGKMKSAMEKGLEPKKGIYTMRDFKEFFESGKIKNDSSDNYIDNEEVVDELKLVEPLGSQTMNASISDGLAYAFSNVRRSNMYCR